ncbi:histidine-rich glycoprotein [Podarcis muralis]
MELLAAAVLMAVLLGSNGENQAAVVSADCNDAGIEKDAGVALDLINKHRKDGYIFTLLRVADAHIQHAGNDSIMYLTLDVLETECSVLSRKNWSSCGNRPFYGYTDFGRCKAVVQINRFLEEEKLHRYNCTVSPVPPEIYECKDCPVRVTVIEATEEHMKYANGVLEQYNQDSNQTNYYKVEEIKKVFSAVADRTAYVVEFTIKETSCPRASLARNISACEFLPDGTARKGLCRGKAVKESDAKDPSVIEIESCEIFDIQDTGKGCHVCGHTCRHPPHGHPHNQDHHHHGPCQHHHHHSFGPHHGHHKHHGHHRHGHGHHGHGHHGHAGPRGDHNCSEEYPDFPPPPGPCYPPPPPGGPHHFPPLNGPPPPPGPPHGPLCHPPPPPDVPDDRPMSPPNQRVRRHSNHHKRCHGPRCRMRSAGRRRGGSSEERSSFEDHHPFHSSKAGSVYYIPVASPDNVLQVPGADFFGGPDSQQGGHRGPPLCGKGFREKPALQPFPEADSESKSCPGKPKYDRPGLLSLYPQ